MIIDVGMTPNLIYTTKAAIIIGVVVSLAVGLAIGATVVAKAMEDNRIIALNQETAQLETRLAQLEANARIVTIVTLNDDEVGNSAGWNPGASTADRQAFDFTIMDSKVVENSIVYATFVVQHELLWDYDGNLPVQEPQEAACFTNPAMGSFTMHCAYAVSSAPAQGSTLKYAVIHPSTE